MRSFQFRVPVRHSEHIPMELLTRSLELNLRERSIQPREVKGIIQVWRSDVDAVYGVLIEEESRPADTSKPKDWSGDAGKMAEKVADGRELENQLRARQRHDVATNDLMDHVWTSLRMEIDRCMPGSSQQERMQQIANQIAFHFGASETPGARSTSVWKSPIVLQIESDYKAQARLLAENAPAARTS